MQKQHVRSLAGALQHRAQRMLTLSEERRAIQALNQHPAAGICVISLGECSRTWAGEKLTCGLQGLWVRGRPA